jgi:hypothetical protein
MLDRPLTVEGAAQALGWPKARVTARVKLLELPERAQQLIGDGVIPLSAVDQLRAIGTVAPKLLDAVVAYLDDGNAWAAERLAREPGWVLDAALTHAGDSKVFAAYLHAASAHEISELRLGKKTEQLYTEAEQLQLDPMITRAEDELQAAGVEDRPGVVLADAGYWSNNHIDSLRERGIVPLVAPDTNRNKPRSTRRGGPYDFMRRVLATETAGGLYSQRQWMVEPVFAQIKTNRRIDRFKRRGQAAARSEWRLITATHNLLKLHRHTLQAATS